MTVSEMIIKLESNGLSVSKVPEDILTLHVDGYLSPNGRGLPDWIYSCPGWGVSSCGFGRVFLFKMR